jgi:hypothetical protein
MMSRHGDRHVEAIRILNLEGIRPPFEKGSTMLTSNLLKTLEVEEPRIKKAESRTRRSTRNPTGIELADDSSLLDRILKCISSRSCRILIDDCFEAAEL